MATDAQINANRKNAHHSTGPRTEAGKTISARNALTLGLFTKTDYVRPVDQSAYNELCARCVTEINPKGVLEETLVTAIVSAAWRLRRCATVERELAGADKLDPMQDAWSRDTQTSIDRARSHASLLLHRSTAELRRLQTDRAIVKKLPGDNDQLPALASARQIVAVINQHRLTQHKPTQPHTGSSASFRNNGMPTPRSASCPCGSGEKFKRYCGKDALPVLNPGERKVA